MLRVGRKITRPLPLNDTTIPTVAERLASARAQWLESELVDPKTALLLVTHDRYFLERTCPLPLPRAPRRVPTAPLRRASRREAGLTGGRAQARRSSSLTARASTAIRPAPLSPPLRPAARGAAPLTAVKRLAALRAFDRGQTLGAWQGSYASFLEARQKREVDAAAQVELAKKQASASSRGGPEAFGAAPPRARATPGAPARSARACACKTPRPRRAGQGRAGRRRARGVQAKRELEWVRRMPKAREAKNKGRVERCSPAPRPPPRPYRLARCGKRPPRLGAPRSPHACVTYLQRPCNVWITACNGPLTPQLLQASRQGQLGAPQGARARPPSARPPYSRYARGRRVLWPRRRRG